MADTELQAAARIVVDALWDEDCETDPDHPITRLAQALDASVFDDEANPHADLGPHESGDCAFCSEGS